MKNVKIAEAYYTAVGNKNIASIEKHLHPDIQCIGPFAKLKGKQAFLEAVQNFTHLFKTLKIRENFGAGDQVTVIYDLECPEPIGSFSTAVLMTFQDELIAKLELFFDARPFEKKK